MPWNTLQQRARAGRRADLIAEGPARAEWIELLQALVVEEAHLLHAWSGEVLSATGFKKVEIQSE
jgi:hypothetical protein